MSLADALAVALDADGEPGSALGLDDLAFALPGSWVRDPAPGCPAHLVDPGLELADDVREAAEREDLAAPRECAVAVLAATGELALLTAGGAGALHHFGLPFLWWVAGGLFVAAVADRGIWPFAADVRATLAGRRARRRLPAGAVLDLSGIEMSPDRQDEVAALTALVSRAQEAAVVAGTTDALAGARALTEALHHDRWRVARLLLAGRDEVAHDVVDRAAVTTDGVIRSWYDAA